MKKLKRTLKVSLMAVMAATCALSAAACDVEGGDPGHTHNGGDAWSGYSSTQHWHVCTDHDQPVAWGHENHTGTENCTKCSWVKGSESDVTYKVTLHLNNGTMSGATEYQVKQGEALICANPTRDGYTFDYWCTDSALENPYDKSTPVTGNLDLYAHYTKNSGETPVKKTYSVDFVTNCGASVTSQTIAENDKVIRPTVENPGKQLVNWYYDSACTMVWNFDNPVTQALTLYAKWVDLNPAIVSTTGYNESLAVTWKEGAPSSSSAYYRLNGTAEWTQVDSELIRSVSASEARVDMVGLTAGNYDVKIQPSSGNAIELPAPIAVTAHDRSGYAHFKYTDGIGAYNDDGTLKNNALVIYVTNENKDTVMSNIDAQYKFNVPSYFTNKWNGKQADGIGWWLNNGQYTKCEKNSKGEAIEKSSSNTYAPNGGSLGFAKHVAENIPICIRFIGNVKTPEGCTAYDSLDEGGTEGDGGNMARMKDYKNVTIEGIGSDATIDGWGFHFMAGDSSNGKGSSFEIRNLTFVNYSEDAVGMEGASKTNAYTDAPVSRCWVHHNTFLPGDGTIGGTVTPTDSDKAEGDGSCDFKRGEYFTLSYNYFDDCHKTNLIGASTSNWQYNVTYHHNWWNNAQSRVPLLRNSNVHFYNNYVSVSDSNDYVHGMEGTSYLFSEANYYMNCKQIMRPSKGGYVKAWNNTYYGCYDNKGYATKATESQYYFEATTREQAIQNDCVYYNGTSLASFDTNPNLFYYDAQNKKSDCLLDDSVTARLKIVEYAGCNDWGTNNPKKQGGNVQVVFKPNVNEKTPASTVPVPDEGVLTIDLNSAKANGTVNGVLFAVDGKSGQIKGKGQLIFFTLATEAEISFTATASDGYYLAELVRADGKVFAGQQETNSPGFVTITKASDVKCVLPAGTYVISSGSGTTSGNNAKEVTITSLSFQATANSAKAKLEALDAAITAIGNVTLSSGTAIENAKTLRAALKPDEIATFNTTYPGQLDKLTAAEAELSELQVGEVERLIGLIGEVDDDSYPAISDARTAYDALTSTQKGQVSNYSTLTAAEDAWKDVAVRSVNKQIVNRTDISGYTASTAKTTVTTAIEQYEGIKAAYEALTETQKGQINNYNTITEGLTQLNALLTQIETAETEAANLADFEAKLNALTKDSVTIQTGAELKAAYDKLTTAQQGSIDTTKYNKYNEIIKAYDDLVAAEAAKTTTIKFIQTNSTKGTSAECSSSALSVTASGNNVTCSYEIEGVTCTTALKLESSSGTVTFTAAADCKLTIYLTKNETIKVNGAATSKAAAVAGQTELYSVTVDLTKDTEYTLTKGGSANLVLLVIKNG